MRRLHASAPLFACCAGAGTKFDGYASVPFVWALSFHQALAPSLGQNLSGGRCFSPARAVSPASSRLREGGDGPAVIAGIRA